jgi:heterodisulfide reductase subunit A-like polyferredoxin
MASTLIGKQAVVIGAGMAGLTAAGALADRFDQVVVLERLRPSGGPPSNSSDRLARSVCYQLPSQLRESSVSASRSYQYSNSSHPKTISVCCVVGIGSVLSLQERQDHNDRTKCTRACVSCGHRRVHVERTRGYPIRRPMEDGFHYDKWTM